MSIAVGVLISGGVGGVLRFLVDAAGGRRVNGSSRSARWSSTSARSIDGLGHRPLFGLSDHAFAAIGGYSTFPPGCWKPNDSATQPRMSLSARSWVCLAITRPVNRGHHAGTPDRKTTVSEQAWKLSAYFPERLRTEGGAWAGFIADQILNLFDDRKVASSVMLRGISSFGPIGVLRSDESLSSRRSTLSSTRSW